MTRGTGGLVTALTGLASYRPVTWIASAMSEGDARRAQEAGNRPFTVQLPGGDGEYQVRLVVSDPFAYDRFYNVVANPMLWFIQHYLWDLSNAPSVGRAEVEAYEQGYCVVNEDLAKAVLEETEDEENAVVMLHDYHLYLAPNFIRQERPVLFLPHCGHIP